MTSSYADLQRARGQYNAVRDILVILAAARRRRDTNPRHVLLALADQIIAIEQFGLTAMYLRIKDAPVGETWPAPDYGLFVDRLIDVAAHRAAQVFAAEVDLLRGLGNAARCGVVPGEPQRPPPAEP